MQCFIHPTCEICPSKVSNYTWPASRFQSSMNLVFFHPLTLGGNISLSGWDTMFHESLLKSDMFDPNLCDSQYAWDML